MGLAGVWHGAGTQYLIFGLLHGIYITVNHAARIFFPAPKKPPKRPWLVEAATRPGRCWRSTLLRWSRFAFFRAASTGAALRDAGRHDRAARCRRIAAARDAGPACRAVRHRLVRAQHPADHVPRTSQRSGARSPTPTRASLGSRAPSGRWLAAHSRRSACSRSAARPSSSTSNFDRRSSVFPDLRRRRGTNPLGDHRQPFRPAVAARRRVMDGNLGCRERLDPGLDIGFPGRGHSQGRHDRQRAPVPRRSIRGLRRDTSC